MPGIPEFPLRWAAAAAREALARDDIPLATAVAPSHLVNATTFITRGGTYQRVWNLEGIPWEITPPGDIFNTHDTYSHWLASLPGHEWRVYRYRLQRRAHARLTPIEDGYAAQLDEALAAKEAARPFLVTEHFLALEYIPPRLRERQGGIGDALARMLGSDRRTPAQIAADEAAALKALDERTASTEAALRDLNPRLLGEYEQDGVRFSELAEFLGLTVNGTWARVRADCGLLYQALPAVRLSQGPAVVELAGISGSRFAAMLDIKEYANAQVGILNGLLLQNDEFLEVQCWEPMPRTDGVASLQRQHNYLMSTEDVSDTQRLRLKEAMDAVQDGREVMGAYAYGLAVFGDSPQAALDSASRVAGSVMQTARGLQLAKVELLADQAWKLNIPGNFGRAGVQPRTAELTNRAYAALTAPHEVRQGKRWGNPWGEALWLARTASGRPFYASAHASPAKTDVAGERYPANVTITGKTGSGKSTSVNVFLALSRRWFPAPRIGWLDYNRANEAFLRRIGGIYLCMLPGERTGMNPFRRPRMGYPTAEHVLQWRELVKQCIWHEKLGLLPDEDDEIAVAAERIAQMPSHMRSITRLRENLPSKTRSADRPTVFERLRPWCRGSRLGADGELAWVFDGDDTLPEPEEAQVIGWDYTAIIDRPEICGPLVLAITQYKRSMLGHGRIILGGDEVWKALTNEDLAAFYNDMERTARFQDALVLKATQQPEDHAESLYGRTSLSQTSTFIALCDPNATADCYVKRMGFSEVALQTIRDLNKDGVFRCLWWQPSEGDPVQLELPDLRGLHDHLAILSGAKENLPLLDAARAEAGDNAEAWTPLFLAAVRERRARNTARVRRVA
jgi:type IV secretion system protein VirB4